MTATRTLSYLLWLAMAVAIAAACRERLPTRFPHKTHLVDLKCGGPGEPQCLDCASCHLTTAGGEPGKPTFEGCFECHGSNMAHLKQAAARPEMTPLPVAHQVRFDHQQHLKMPGIRGQCVKCHGGVVEPASTLFPPMASCFACHEHQAQWEAVQCEPCHSDAEVRLLRPTSFMAHDENWLRHHGQEVRSNPTMCRTCHGQQSCDDCHAQLGGLRFELRRPEALFRERVHPADFVTRHALEARSEPARCLTCHTTETCEACHTQRGVSANLRTAANPHPPGWVGGNPSSLSFHGRAARRDLLACASCHDQGPATNCIDCHRVGGPGGNPHPRGWQSARTEAASMCRYCHER